VCECVKEGGVGGSGEGGRKARGTRHKVQGEGKALSIQPLENTVQV